MNTTKYKTKQLEELLEYLKLIQGTHINVLDVSNYFKSKNIKIGTTTIYRLLDKLVNEGLVNKYYIDNSTSACFEYTGDLNHRHSCYHLKCEKCKKLIHLNCKELDLIEDHIKNEHHFILNTAKTVFYGVCSECNK